MSGLLREKGETPFSAHCHNPSDTPEASDSKIFVGAPYLAQSMHFLPIRVQLLHDPPVPLKHPMAFAAAQSLQSISHPTAFPINPFCHLANQDGTKLLPEQLRDIR